MAFKVTSAHWEIIVNFMETHPELAQGRINGPCAKDTLKKLWSALTVQLNSVGLGERSALKWQKTWVDFKYALKKKAAQIKKDINGTGGGPAKGGGLSDIEIKILDILGKTFYEGCGRIENGLQFMNNSRCETVTSATAENPNTSHLHNEIVLPSTSVTHKEPAVPAPYKTVIRDKTQNAADLVLQDHEYTKKPSKREQKRVRADLEMERLYKETLSQLKDINSSLKQLVNGVHGIEQALLKLVDKASKSSL